MSLTHLSLPDMCHGIVDKFNTENQLIKVIPVEKELIIEFGKITFIEIGSLQTFSILASKRTSTVTSSKTQLITVGYHRRHRRLSGVGSTPKELRLPIPKCPEETTFP